eukprot:g16454.t1
MTGTELWDSIFVDICGCHFPQQRHFLLPIFAGDWPTPAIRPSLTHTISSPTSGSKRNRGQHSSPSSSKRLKLCDRTSEQEGSDRMETQVMSGGGDIDSHGFLTLESFQKGLLVGVESKDHSIRHTQNAAVKNGSKSEAVTPVAGLATRIITTRSGIRFRCHELLQLIIHTLHALSLSVCAELLEKESGVSSEDPAVRDLRHAILSGSWEEVTKLLPSLGVKDEVALRKVTQLFYKQQYLELLEQNKVMEAVELLRKLSLHDEQPEQLQTLAGLLLFTQPAQLRREAKWDGAQGLSRARLLQEMHDLLPVSVLASPMRLFFLLDQAAKYQVLHQHHAQNKKINSLQARSSSSNASDSNHAAAQCSTQAAHNPSKSEQEVHVLADVFDLLKPLHPSSRAPSGSCSIFSSSSSSASLLSADALPFLSFTDSSSSSSSSSAAAAAAVVASSLSSSSSSSSSSSLFASSTDSSSAADSSRSRTASLSRLSSLTSRSDSSLWGSSSSRLDSSDCGDRPTEADPVSSPSMSSVSSLSLQSSSEDQPALSFSRQHFIRILLQCLESLGCKRTAKLLSQRTGIEVEKPATKALKQGILKGKWEAVEVALDSLSLPPYRLKMVQVLVGEQRYLELLEAGDPLAALSVLRSQMLPNLDSLEHLQTLAGYLLWTPEALREHTKWKGSQGGSRLELLHNLAEWIPSGTFMPPERLFHLIEHALQYQVQCCRYHEEEPSTMDHANGKSCHHHDDTSSGESSGQVFSLLKEHHCPLKLQLHPEPQQILTDHTDEVLFLAFSHDGTRLASGSRDHTVIIWKRSSASSSSPSSPASTLPASARKPKRRRQGEGESATAGAQREAAAAGGVASVRNAASTTASSGRAGRVVYSGRAASRTRTASSSGGSGSNNASNGEDGASSSSSRSRGNANQEEATSTTQSEEAVAFPPSASGKSSCNQDGFVAQFVLEGHEAAVWFLAWSPDDKYLVSCTEDASWEMKLWNTETGECIFTVDEEGHSEPISAVSWLPDSQTFLSGSLDRCICTWDVTGKLISQYEGAERVQDMLLMAASPQHPGNSNQSNGKESKSSSALAAHRLIVASTSSELCVYTLPLKEGQRPLKAIRSKHPVTALAPSVSGRAHFLLNLAAPASSINLCLLSPLLAEPNQLVPAQVFTGFQQKSMVVRSALAGSEDNYVVCGSEDHCVYVFHRNTGCLLYKLEGHTATVNSVSASPCSVRDAPLLIASGCDDHSIRIWLFPVMLKTSMQPDCHFSLKSHYNLWTGMRRTADDFQVILVPVPYHWRVCNLF